MSTNNDNLLQEKARIYAEKHLNENETNREVCLASIKKWLESDEQINGNTEDKAILPFLRGCKYDLEKTKEKLQNFYAMKRDVPEWFMERDPTITTIQELVSRGVFVPLAKTHENKFVIIMRIGAYNPSMYHVNDVIKAGLMILDILSLENELLQVYGVIAIFDMENISFGHAKQLTPNIIKKVVGAWQNYHCRPKQLEFVNAPFYIHAVLSVFKSFMSVKLKNRIRVHPYGTENVKTIVSESILPAEYEGSEGNMVDLANEWKERLVKYKDWFAEDEQYKSNKK